MALTRSRATSIVILCIGVLYLALLIRSNISDSPEESIMQGPITRGPNPDGSWGTYAEPMVKVNGTRVNLDTGEITIFMIVDVGTGGKHTTHITLPLDSTIEEAK